MDTSRGLKILSLLILIAVGTDSEAVNWSYDGAEGTLPPQRWNVGYPTCGGPNQSPVWLRPSKAVPRHYQPFMSYLNDPSFALRNVTLQNNGHTVELVFPARKYILQGGGLEAKYYAASLHFHWGPNNTYGEENEVGGSHYPLELHLVHHKAIYSNLTVAKAALNDSSAIAVLAILMQVKNNQWNKYFAPLVDRVKVMKGRNPSASSVNTTLPSLALGSLVKNAYTSGYYRYQGSLTTPACNVQVVWTVFDKHLTISPYQIQPFRSLINRLGTAMRANTRPIQPIGSRKIYHSK